MLPFLRKNPAFVGIAVHHDRLSMLKLQQFRKKIYLQGFAIRELPAGSLVDGKILKLDHVIRVMKELAQKVGAIKCHAATALPVSQVINKRITMPPYLNDKERNIEIDTNLQDYFPGMNEPVNFDFIKPAQQETEWLLVAARAEQVATYTYAAQQAGIKVDIVDIDIYALARAICFAQAEQQLSMVINMDSASVQFFVLRHKKIMSSQSVMLDISDNEVQQIKFALQRFATHEEIVACDQIVLTGNSLWFNDIKRYLQEELQMTVKIPFPFQQINLSSDIELPTLTHHSSELLTAFGLALRGFATCSK